jgi:hypothetical protein
LPERYDPRRITTVSGKCISDLVSFSEKTIAPKSIVGLPNGYMVIDTTNSFNGFIHLDKSDINKKVESNKKIVSLGSIIVSRLRPYLRQVGFVDEHMTSNVTTKLASTEYFVLESKGSESIAFLIPFLLATRVQDYLQHSIEGGNHPRFKLDSLASLVVPQELIDQRTEISIRVEEAINSTRIGYSRLNEILETHAGLRP